MDTQLQQANQKIRDLEKQIIDERAQYNAFLNKLEIQVNESGQITLSPYGYSEWARRKGDELTQRILQENERLRAEAASIRQTVVEECRQIALSEFKEEGWHSFFGIAATAIAARLGDVLIEQCDHVWTDIRSEVCAGGECCFKCGKLRTGNQSACQSCDGCGSKQAAECVDGYFCERCRELAGKVSV